MLIRTDAGESRCRDRSKPFRQLPPFLRRHSVGRILWCAARTDGSSLSATRNSVRTKASARHCSLPSMLLMAWARKATRRRCCSWTSGVAPSRCGPTASILIHPGFSDLCCTAVPHPYIGGGVRTDAFDFELPPKRIALRPIAPRDCARLLTIRPGSTPELSNHVVRELPDL